MATPIVMTLSISNRLYRTTSGRYSMPVCDACNSCEVQVWATFISDSVHVDAKIISGSRTSEGVDYARPGEHIKCFLTFTATRPAFKKYDPATKTVITVPAVTETYTRETIRVDVPIACATPFTSPAPYKVGSFRDSVMWSIPLTCNAVALWYRVDGGEWIDIPFSPGDAVGELVLDGLSESVNVDVMQSNQAGNGDIVSLEEVPGEGTGPNDGGGIEGKIVDPNGNPPEPDTVIVDLIPEDPNLPIVHVPIAPDGTFDSGELPDDTYEIIPVLLEPVVDATNDPVEGLADGIAEGSDYGEPDDHGDNPIYDSELGAEAPNDYDEGHDDGYSDGKDAGKDAADDAHKEGGKGPDYIDQYLDGFMEGYEDNHGVGDPEDYGDGYPEDYVDGYASGFAAGYHDGFKHVFKLSSPPFNMPVCAPGIVYSYIRVRKQNADDRVIGTNATLKGCGCDKRDVRALTRFIY